ncbi:MAG: 1,4-dihydroxy-2-naphthoate octaprenyltransferase [Proteobacteria bacterium]|nr:1,4-dihydroxy-2-naphthoate octaprenyltransferase [Pseudomonadota bacterium]
MSNETLKAWIQASRPPFFIATLAPLLIGWMSAKAYGLHLDKFFLVIFGSFIVHLVTNLANDYFDYIKGADSGESIGGSRVIQEGKILPDVLLKAIIILYCIAFLIAFTIMFSFNLFAILPLVLFAAFSSFFYVAPPIRYGYYGLGELFVGINMGPIIVVGTYWVIAGRFDWAPFYLSLPVGLMVASILYYQSLPDMKTDLAAGKYTLAVRLGKRGAFVGLIVFWVLIYLAVIALILTNALSWYALICLASIPVCVKMIRTVKNTEDWVLLDQYGRYVRILYGLNSIAIISGLFK